MLIPTDTMILIVDGSRLQILCNVGTAADLRLDVIADETHSNPPSRVLETDLSGRMGGSGAMSSDSLQRGDPHQLAEDDFIAAALSRVETLVGKDQRLVIIAPPKALGHLRARMSATLAARVLAEFDKDLAHRPPHEIAMYLHNHRE